MAYFSCSNQDGAIQVRSSVDPTFYSLVGSGRSEGTTTAPLFSIIHTSLISVWTTITRAQLFFHDFPGGPEKAAINKIFLILPSRNEEREIRFPFHRD
ncbi:hypothetical protein V6Z12_D10G210900 [Gossypium hirsutum]